MRKVNIGIVGITGLVGQTILEILETADIEIDQLFIYASVRSKGKEILFKGQSLIVKALSEESFNDPLDIVFFAVESDLVQIYAPLAVKKGMYVIDNSSAYRMHKDIPLVVPEVNGHHLKKDSYLIANPNCSTIQSVVALNAVHKLFGLEEVVYTTYQAVSGSGVSGLEDLEHTTQGGQPKFYPKQIYDNVMPQIDVFLENGYTKEEMKMVLETNKILGSHMNVISTTVRVPVKVGHSVLIYATTKKDIDLNLLLNVYASSPEIKLYKREDYPTPQDAAGTDIVHIGRVRRDLNHLNKVLLWTVADNVRKGAALNAVQIANYIYKEFIK